MFSWDLSHPSYPYAVIGAKCLNCYTDVWYYENAKEQRFWYQEEFVNPTARLCKCKTIGCVIDDEGTFHLYADDITKVHMGHFIFNKAGDLLSTEWWNVSGSFIYVDYTVKRMAKKCRDKDADVCTPISTAPSNKVSKKSWYDTELVNALDAYSDLQSRTHYYTNNWKVK